MKKPSPTHEKKENFVLICVLQHPNASLIPGISKWKKELIFSGVAHPAKNPCVSWQKEALYQAWASLKFWNHKDVLIFPETISRVTT